MAVVGGKWTENHRQGKSLNNQMSEEGFSVQVKRHWVTLQACTIKWAILFSQKVISLHNSEVLWRVFIGTRWIIDFFFVSLADLESQEDSFQPEWKEKNIDFFVNWKVKQIIIWRFRMRYLFLKKKNQCFVLMVAIWIWFECLKITEISERKCCFEQEKSFNWKNIENYLTGNSEGFFSLILKNTITLAKLLNNITVSYSEVLLKTKSPVPRLDGLSFRSKLLKEPEPAVPRVPGIPVAQELDKRLFHHCKVTDRNHSYALSRACIRQLSVRTWYAACY